jgi:thymidylate synthase (FAD)
VRIVDAGFEFAYVPSVPMQRIEAIARTCYKSEDRITDGSADTFVRTLRGRGHMAMLDHVTASVRFVVDRGATHEMVRHRIGVAFAQESTRYCNYSKAKFGSEIAVIRPCFWSEACRKFSIWHDAMGYAERAYFQLIAEGASPQEARSVLPNSLKTEIVVTADFTEWRHIFQQRTSAAAHPQMREVMVPLLAEFQKRWPAAFDDLGVQQ